MVMFWAWSDELWLNVIMTQSGSLWHVRVHPCLLGRKAFFHHIFLLQDVLQDIFLKHIMLLESDGDETSHFKKWPGCVPGGPQWKWHLYVGRLPDRDVRVDLPSRRWRQETPSFRVLEHMLILICSAQKIYGIGDCSPFAINYSKTCKTKTLNHNISLLARDVYCMSPPSVCLPSLPNAFSYYTAKTPKQLQSSWTFSGAEQFSR